jgi:hypothetical protein
MSLSIVYTKSWILLYKDVSEPLKIGDFPFDNPLMRIRLSEEK